MTHPPPSATNWWQRNWKWFVPTVAIGGIALIAGGIALILSLVFGLMKNSEPYQTALARATTSVEVRAALGTPITTGFFVTGEINLNNDDGVAKLSIPISGPEGAATIDVQATKTSGRWNYSRLLVTLADGGRKVDLTAEANQPAIEAVP